MRPARPGAPRTNRAAPRLTIQEDDTHDGLDQLPLEDRPDARASAHPVHGLLRLPRGVRDRFSLTNSAGFGAAKFVGLDNYTALTSDPFFWQSLKNTVVILVVSLVILVPASFGLALLLRQRKGSGALRALVFGPAIIAPILVGLIWVFILDPRVGLLNRLLDAVGLPPVQWIGGNTLTPYAVSVVFIWSSIGFAMTIFYAGLQLLPGDVMEAATLDGATSWQRLRHVTVPMMRETFAIVTILLITNVFKIFELVYMLTGGGPVHRSETLVSYMYFVTFTNQRYGSGMAIAW